ncbi:DHS-like NAD/FAD-binding domain-containing protein [Dichomitus squalens LYAD-421 SS1]|uniref:DHS-like NAD/FAD-binding domain-containing protein n=1 Tax=Dichomitus squalens (strain LYAD-421) TaxID=732165 RepID=UPI0004410A1E|nr:DHS-like NAD/FAD-binding domain-containing protein [Dichomitus squalens LYAD-421 SS1]EJF66826.1 DHS-like NAD/FAD-binding domain-containing protein [Dichomitus squalens LYAD-421 SS1]
MLTLDLDASGADAHARRQLANLSLAVAKCKRIVVVTGAGISCSCGIPDFRSSDGLYALVKQQYPDAVLKGRDLFDASLFRDPTSTAVFYTFISQLKKSIDAAKPSPTHRFIKTLDSKRKLLRSYTQNIDGLEERVGIVSTSSEGVKTHGKGKSKIRTKDVRNVQLHGDIHRVRCTFCSADYPCTPEHLETFLAGTPPDCPDCAARSTERVARSARALKVGKLRPAIVLYDEPHPLGDDIGSIQTADIARKPDMLIIMGTSLKVHGFKKLVKDFARTVHESAPSPSASAGSPLKKNAKSFAGKVVFVNKTAPGSEWDSLIDYHVSGETDRWVEKVIEDWKKARPADWEVQKTLVATGDATTGGTFHVAKEITNTMGTKAAKGAKRKPARRRENAPLPEDEIFDITLPLPEAPPSPSKRPQSRCHYHDVESSPSKKSRDGRRPVREPVHFEERGLLFGNATNSKAQKAPEDDFDLGENVQKPKAAKKVVTHKMHTSQVEVVLESRRPTKRVALA